MQLRFEFFKLVPMTLIVWVYQVWGDCEIQKHIILCPSLLVADPNEETPKQVVVGCVWGDLKEPFHSVDLEIVNSSGAYRVANLFAGSPPSFVSSSRNGVRPQGELRLSGTSGFFNLTQQSVDISSLVLTWQCMIFYRKSSNSTHLGRLAQQATVKAIPYPRDATLSIIPQKPFYSTTDTVNLTCTAFLALAISRERRLSFSFQYSDQDLWVPVSIKDQEQTVRFLSGKDITEGDIIRGSCVLQLPVSSIAGCSRRYRCLLSYMSTVFEDAAAEQEVRVEAGPSNCGAAERMPLFLPYRTAPVRDGDTGDNDTYSTTEKPSLGGVAFLYTLLIGGSLLLLFGAVTMFLILKQLTTVKSKFLQRLGMGGKANQQDKQEIEQSPRDGAKPTDSTAHYFTHATGDSFHFNELHDVDIFGPESSIVDVYMGMPEVVDMTHPDDINPQPPEMPPFSGPKDPTLPSKPQASTFMSTDASKPSDPQTSNSKDIEQPPEPQTSKSKDIEQPPEPQTSKFKDTTQPSPTPQSSKPQDTAQPPEPQA